MRPVEFIIKDGDEHLISHSGLALIGILMDRMELSAHINDVTLPGCREPNIPHSDIVKSMIGLLYMEKRTTRRLRRFGTFPFSDTALGLSNVHPARPSGRGWMVVKGSFDGIAKEESARLICKTAPGVGTVSTRKGELAALDIDVSPFDNSKRENRLAWGNASHPGWFCRPLRIVFEVTERTTKDDQYLLIPEVDTHWTSLEDHPYQAILLYHDHGTCEQFHSEIKTDMDIERLPSEHFSINSDIMTLALMA